MSANPLTASGGIYTYDFTTAAGQAYGTGTQKNLGGGIYGMYAGDTNADGIIDNADISGPWSSDAGESGYMNADANMNGQADNKDKDNVWYFNMTKESQLPE